MRSIWTGMLSFGMVNIPVSVLSATRKQTISFNQLCRRDNSRVKYKKVAADGQEVTATEIVRGYEISPERYVIIEDSELAAIAPESSRIVNITDFVKLEEIDSRHYDASYYLVPNKGAGKAYKLLHNALTESNTVAIAKFTLRSKEYLAAIRAAGRALVLNTMLFPNELVNTSELEAYLPDDVELTDKEIQMARYLVETMTAKFEPGKYKNEYQERVMHLIDSKAETHVVDETVPQDQKVVNLMAALEASIADLKENTPKIKKTRKSKLKKEA